MSEHTVGELAAIEDIRRLEARYAYYADHKQWEDLAGLFTKDGWFRPLDVDGNQISFMAGRDDIAGQLSSRMAGDVQPIHHLFTHEIEITSPTSARAVWAMADLVVWSDGVAPAVEQPGFSAPPSRVMRGWGHYHVTYVNVRGQWLISTRIQTRTRLEVTA
ncbi:nuclear transport factor 2 family protein [Streptomyces sp. NPDC047009]|uniref:nuclear transport factor 2 family protein n=1 Tax=unclassified Streptomyces TaxID=2593676 RepID=UPI0033EF9DAA